VSTLWFDLRYTLRLLGRSPGFAALSVMVIALALALALTIYVIVRNQGIEPLPLPDGDRYVALQHVYQNSGRIAKGDRFHANTLQTLAVSTQSFEVLGAARLNGSTTINDGGITEAPWGTEISPELMRLTGTKPLMGRSLNEQDSEPGAQPVVLIGHQLWQTFFGARPDIIGYRVRIEGEMHTVIGVMPEGFRYPTDHHLWRPLQLPPNSPPGDHSAHYTPIGILKQGVTREEAGREVAGIIADLQRQYPDEYENVTATAIPFIDAASTTDFGVMNIVMLAAATSILLLACLNVGNLLLVRASERTQELVIRSALGGTRARIMRQVLLESMLISLLGGGLGLWLGTYGARFVKYQTEVVVGSTFLPFWMRFDISADVLLIATGATLLIWLLAGGIPAWRASRVEINTALAGGSKGVAGRGNSRVSTTLVAAEVVLSFFLLVLSGAFVATVNKVSGVEFGLSAENTVSGMVVLDEKRYKDAGDRLRYFQNLENALEAEPGIQHAAVTTVLPGFGWWRAAFDLPDLDLQQAGELPQLQGIPVSTDYFQNFGVRLLEGRYFSTTDSDENLQVAIIDRDMAEHFWPGESALGKKVEINPEEVPGRPPTREVTIVGVIQHIDQGQALGHSRDIFNLYHPLAQFTPEFGMVVVKFEQQPEGFAQQIRSVATRVDRDTAIMIVRPLDESMSMNTRILGTLSELFVVVALIALVLAGTGIYGVVSRSVLLRTRDMGIRRALGQTDRETVRFFLRQGSLFLLAGALVGGGSAVAAAWLLTAEFPSLLDSMVSIVIIISVVMVALVLGASYLPARNMVRMEPAAALHHE
jgi:putative ABC transport system permease protein